MAYDKEVDMKSHEPTALLDELKVSGDANASSSAEALAELYHARQMALIAQDSYDVARNSGEAPAGWIRASGDLAALRKLMPDVGVSDEQLRSMLQPDESGFRAEIYIPDPTILGPGYKPTLVFKGSAGEVIGPDGATRETAAEDFLANNFPQSVGLKTDYYDRAMNLGVFLRRSGLDFDITGHSLGGGMTSAASAVTGMRAFTYNAAGLHPDTARRFAAEQGGLPLYDTAHTVTAWQVQGEVLNDGVQRDLAGLGERDRRRLAGLLADTASLLRELPQARETLKQSMAAHLPESTHSTVHAFLDRLAQPDAAVLIRDLPQAAGDRRPPLVAMTEHDRALVRREEVASMAELHRLAGPLLQVAASTARGAELGRSAGELAASGGRIADTGLDWAGARASEAWSWAGDFAGQGYRVTGIAAQWGAQSLGDVAGHWRRARAGAEALALQADAWMDARRDDTAASFARVVGWAAGAHPGATADRLQSQADGMAATLEARAAQARAHGEAAAADALERGRQAAATFGMIGDALGQAANAGMARRGETARATLHAVGDRMQVAFDAAGEPIATGTGRVPAAGAAIGATTGAIVGAATTYRPDSPFTASDVTATVRLWRQGPAALHESVERHGMAGAMIPSLDVEIARQERAARALLQSRQRAQSGPVPAESGAARPDSGTGRTTDAEVRSPLWQGESGRALGRLLDALREGDAERIGAASTDLLGTSAARDWLQAGQARLDAMPPRRPAADDYGALSCPAPDHVAELMHGR
ncbi:phospholipase [Luteimonas kalidii]|uniref:Phospholipase n=1 Tax=Luteimonas kalidii TaxID=3042025 RepID=A0ABT6JWR2_9GAMM|nr:phospholipase [Luteimonas kalidii]MDH5835130.1 phospholipase [Luteimonas kalidii]